MNNALSTVQGLVLDHVKNSNYKWSVAETSHEDEPVIQVTAMTKHHGHVRCAGFQISVNLASQLTGTGLGEYLKTCCLQVAEELYEATGQPTSGNFWWKASPVNPATEPAEFQKTVDTYIAQLTQLKNLQELPVSSKWNALKEEILGQLTTPNPAKKTDSLQRVRQVVAELTGPGGFYKVKSPGIEFEVQEDYLGDLFVIYGYGSHSYYKKPLSGYAVFQASDSTLRYHVKRAVQEIVSTILFGEGIEYSASVIHDVPLIEPDEIAEHDLNETILSTILSHS